MKRPKKRTHDGLHPDERNAAAVMYAFAAVIGPSGEAWFDWCVDHYARTHDVFARSVLWALRHEADDPDPDWFEYFAHVLANERRAPRRRRLRFSELTDREREIARWGFRAAWGSMQHGLFKPYGPEKAERAKEIGLRYLDPDGVDELLEEHGE